LDLVGRALNMEKGRMIERRHKAIAIERHGKTYLCRVDVEIQWNALFLLLGHRAIANKSKRSRLLSGIIKGQILVGNEIK
jgi:hypothetical protein